MAPENQQMLRVKWLRKYDGYGMEFPLPELMSYIDGHYDIQIFEDDRIIKLDIPFSEIWHRCDEKEWAEVIAFIEDHYGTKDEILALDRRYRRRRVVRTTAIILLILLAIWILILVAPNK